MRSGMRRKKSLGYSELGYGIGLDPTNLALARLKAAISH
jgi:hypothetical protein